MYVAFEFHDSVRMSISHDICSLDRRTSNWLTFFVILLIFWVNIFKWFLVVRSDGKKDVHDSGSHRNDGPADILSILSTKLLLIVELNFVLEYLMT